MNRVFALKEIKIDFLKVPGVDLNFLHKFLDGAFHSTNMQEYKKIKIAQKLGIIKRIVLKIV